MRARTPFAVCDGGEDPADSERAAQDKGSFLEGGKHSQSKDSSRYSSVDALTKVQAKGSYRKDVCHCRSPSRESSSSARQFVVDVVAASGSPVLGHEHISISVAAGCRTISCIDYNLSASLLQGLCPERTTAALLH